MKLRILTIILLLLLMGACSIHTRKQTSIKIINPIVVPKGKEKQALAIWDKYAKYFSQQPGFIGTKLHKSLDPKAKFHLVNVAEWETAADFMKALHSDEIKKIGSGFPKDMPHYPSLYQIIRE